MTPSSNLADAGATDVAGAAPIASPASDLNAGNEIGLGNLSMIQQPVAGPAPGKPQDLASVAAALLVGNQANLAAILRSGQILAAGAHEIGRNWAAASSASLSSAKEAMAAFAAVRSIPDLVTAQSNLVRSMAELAFKQGAHVAASSMRLSHQSLEPIKARVSLAAQAFARAG